MKDEYYLKMIASVEKSKTASQMICMSDMLITFVIFLSYPMLLAYLFYTRNSIFVSCLAVPAIGFLAVTLFRNFYNARRPYEELDFNPIIKKDTFGKSFPSRHVFSIFMIGMTYLQLDSSIAMVIFIMGVLLAALRVFGGVHYIRDVIFGAAVGVLFGAIGYYLVHWTALFPML